MPNLTLPSGIQSLDELFDGGLPFGKITHVFGEAASGKTTLALQFVSSAYTSHIKSVIVYTEPSSPIERLEQITGRRYEDLQDMVLLLVPKDFQQQGIVVDDLELYAADRRLIVVDTLTRLYRVALSDKESTYAAHRELNRQVGMLKGLARYHGTAVLVLNQVRARMGDENDFEPVARSIMEYWEDLSVKMHMGALPGERIIERLIPKTNNCTRRLALTSRGLQDMADAYKQ
ncbi:MAG: ATPase domain-containing protein [Candidatus Thorarchaeota archaeon]